MKRSEKGRLVLPLAVAAVAAVVAVLGLAAGTRWLAERRRAEQSTTIVATVTSTRSAEDNESQVALPLEEALSSVVGLVSLRTESRSGVVLATLVFRGDDGLEGPTRVHDALARAAKTLPSDASPPTVSRIEPEPALAFVLGPEETKNELERTQGVAGVEVCGGKSHRLHVVLDPTRLAANRIEIAAVEVAVAGSVGLPAMMNAAPVDPKELAKIRVSTTAGVPVLLADIAQIVDRPDETRCAFVRDEKTFGSDGVLLVVSKQPGAELGPFRRQIAAKTKELGARLVDPATTVMAGFEAAESHAAAIDQAAWLAMRTGKPKLGAIVHDGRILLLQTAAPDDSEGRRFANELRDLRRADGPLPRYAGIVAAPSGKRPPRLRVTLRGPSSDPLRAWADRLRPAIEGVKGVGASLGTGDVSPTPQLDVKIDRERAALAGVRVEAIARAILAATKGIATSDVVIEVGHADRDDELTTFRTLHVQGIPLDHLVRVERKATAASVLRIDRARAIELRWEVDRDVVSDVKKAIADPNVRVVLDP